MFKHQFYCMIAKNSSYELSFMLEIMFLAEIDVILVDWRSQICRPCIFNKCLTAQLLKKGHWYHKLRKAFSKFYRLHHELISKFNVGLKSLLHQGLSEPEFYGDLVYKFKKTLGRTDFSDQFREMILRHKSVGYDLNVMRQSACLVINPIKVDNFAALFNCSRWIGR